MTVGVSATTENSAAEGPTYYLKNAVRAQYKFER
jgi:hypothetical protein